MLIIYSSINAQDCDYLPLSKFETKDGLSGLNVRKILQDKYGFMWVATQDGLNRFDGRKFIVYNDDNTLSPSRLLIRNDVFDISFDDTQTNLWAITTYGGLFKINILTGFIEKRYDFQYSDNHNKIDSLWMKCLSVKNGDIFIGTDEGSVVIFHIKQEIFEVKKVYDLLNQKGPIDNIFVDYKNRTWLFISGVGILTSDNYIGRVTHYINLKDLSGQANLVFSDITTDDSTLFISTNDGIKSVSIVNYFINAILVNKKISHSIKKGVWHSIFYTDGMLLFSGQKGLFTLDIVSKKINQIIFTKNYSDNNWLLFTSSLFKNGSSIWIGSQNGLGLIKNLNTPFLGIHKSLNNKNFEIGHAYGLLKKNDSLIFVCADNGLFIVNYRSSSIYKLNGIDQYLSAFKASRNYYIASGLGGLISIDNNLNKRNLEVHFPELKEIVNDVLISIASFSDSLIFMASFNQKGLYIWNLKKNKISNITTNTKPLSIGSNEIKNLYLDRNSMLWILSNNSIDIFNPLKKEMNHIKLINPKNKQVLSINMDICELNNKFWIAAYGTGIVEISSDKKVEKIYTTIDGLSNLGVYKLFALNDSLLIISSNNGLSILNIYSKKIYNYFEEDGLHSNNFEETSGCKTDKYIFFGGINGITRIDPSKFTINTTPPTFYYTNIKTKTTDSAELDTSNLEIKQLEIPKNWLQTTISFVGLNYSNPERVTYQYRIIEKDTNWININTQNFVPLIGLSPGTYTLEVKAANEDGYWCAPKQLTLIFEPKWYQTLWFKISVGLAIAGLFYAFYRYRISQIKKQQQIRKDIASDLHDDIGSTLNSVKIFTHLAETAPEKQEYFNQIKDALKQASAGLRDMIWVLDDTQDNIEELIKRLKQFAVPVANVSNINIEFAIDDKITNDPLNKTEKRNLLLIAKEAINNSIKYAECKKIHVSISKINGKTSLQIHDDGKGFGISDITPGNGLKNMQDRARQIHYKVNIASSPEDGTTIIVTNNK